MTTGVNFDPVPLYQVRPGDIVMVPTSPGFKTVEVKHVARSMNGAVVHIDVEANGRRVNSAWVEFRDTGNALVMRPEHMGATTMGDFRRRDRGVGPGEAKGEARS